jgi:hypothetical protein
MQAVKQSLKQVRQSLESTLEQLKEVLVSRNTYDPRAERDDLPTQRNRYYT